MVDIARDPRWGRIMEGSGEDPYLGSLMAAARVKDIRGERSFYKQYNGHKYKTFCRLWRGRGGRDYNTVLIV